MPDYHLSEMASKLYRSLLHELRGASPNGVLPKESLALKYISSQYQKYKTTDETLCKAKEEMKHLGSTYLCYLESLRKYNEIQLHYKGDGERSVADTANMVGFKLPHDPK